MSSTHRETLCQCYLKIFPVVCFVFIMGLVYRQRLINNELQMLSKEVGKVSELTKESIITLVQKEVESKRDQLQSLVREIIDENLRVLDKKVWDITLDVDNVQREIEEHGESMENFKIEIFKVIQEKGHNVFIDDNKEHSKRKPTRTPAIIKPPE